MDHAVNAAQQTHQVDRALSAFQVNLKRCDGFDASGSQVAATLLYGRKALSGEVALSTIQHTTARRRRPQQSLYR